MELTRLVGECKEEGCPTVFTTDRGTAVIRGEQFAELRQLRLSGTETAVEIPLTLLQEAARALGG